MTMEITTITTPMVFKFTVNCYLVKIGDDFILIDTGRANKRQAIEEEMEMAGSRPGTLRLILLTHGDFDHCGNAAYLREKFGAPIAMHRDDSGMAEFGNMFWNRQKPNRLISTMMGLLISLNESDRFKPELFIENGDDLSDYGFEAKVVHIPGHSRGSVGFLTAGGELFCGDLLANTKEPDIWSIIDDPAAAHASVEKLQEFEIDSVYPGHGAVFPMERFIQNYQPDKLLGKAKSDSTP